MKKPLLFALIIVFFNSSYAQSVNYLSQDFNGACASATGFPSNWMLVTPPSIAFDALGQWRCGPSSGRGSSSGILCSGYYAGSNHLDTSYLLTPLLNLSSFAPGLAYLNFDTKTD